MALSYRRPVLLGVAACALLTDPTAAVANRILQAGTTFGIDDYNLVSALLPVATTGDFLDNALKNSGFKTASWVWNQASVGDSVAVRGDTTIDPYIAWVVNEPKFTFPDGTTVGPAGPFDWGGLEVMFLFTPKASDPLWGISMAGGSQTQGTTMTTLHWLQVRHNFDNLGFDQTVVDDSTPWYDVGGVAGIANQAGFGSFLGDAPTAPENGRNVPDPVDPVDPYRYSKRFETYLAVDSFNSVSSVHTVTLYGGWDWGFDYVAADTPEPSAAILVCFGALLMAALQSWRAKTR